MYASYAFYQQHYGGEKVDFETFERLKKRSAAYINSLLGKDLDEVPDAVKMAHCAVIEAMQTNEQGGEVISQSAGGWSQTYAAKQQTPNQRLYDAAMFHLSGTGLVNRWL